MAKCSFCEEEVPHSAVRCGNCGEEFAGLSWWWQQSTGVRFVIVVLPVAVAVFLAVYLESKTVTAPIPRSAFTVTAEKLYQDYSENEIAADARYENRVFTVAGIVASVGKGFWGGPYVILDPHVQCLFDGSHSLALARFRPGKQVRFKCRGGSGILGSPVLSDCEPR